MTPDERWARRRLAAAMPRLTADGTEPQRRLSGEELRVAVASVRWIDPQESEHRIEVAGLADGRRPNLWVPNTESKRTHIVYPWAKPEVAAAARERGGEKNRLKAEAARAGWQNPELKAHYAKRAGEATIRRLAKLKEEAA